MIFVVISVFIRGNDDKVVIDYCIDDDEEGLGIFDNEENGYKFNDDENGEDNNENDNIKENSNDLEKNNFLGNVGLNKRNLILKYFFWNVIIKILRIIN